MPYCQLRLLCEKLRELQYPRLVSIENFREPNFELMADILYWFAQKLEPRTDISDVIDDQKSRVDFIQQIVILFITKGNLKLSSLQLYHADGRAVKEMLKLCALFSNARMLTVNEEYANLDTEEEKLNIENNNKINLKNVQQVLSDVQKIGESLLKSLENETENQKQRQKSLQFLSNLRSLDSNDEQLYIEKCISDIIGQQETSINEMEHYVTNLQKDEKQLDIKIREAMIETQRAESRYQQLNEQEQHPETKLENERLERQLKQYYEQYVISLRNNEYLKQKCEDYLEKDKNAQKEGQDRLKRLRDKLKDEELRVLRGEIQANEDSNNLLDNNDNNDDNNDDSDESI